MRGSDLQGLDTETVAVAEEQDALARALGALAGLDPLAPPGALPHGLDEADGALGDVGAVVLAHDGFDGLGGLVGVVKGDSANVVVQDVRLNDAVEEVAADEAELAINGGGRAAHKVPLLGRVVRERGVGVLEEGDGHWRRVLVSVCSCQCRMPGNSNLPSQWLTHR